MGPVVTTMLNILNMGGGGFGFHCVPFPGQREGPSVIGRGSFLEG